TYLAVIQSHPTLSNASPLCPYSNHILALFKPFFAGPIEIGAKNQHPSKIPLSGKKAALLPPQGV
ncbi:hypothetical protein ACFLZG_06615, partial [Thermodesulfobacteriota bacterium]